MSTWYPEADLVIQHPKIYTVAITCDEVKEGKTDFPIIEDGGVAAKDGKVIAIEPDDSVNQNDSREDCGWENIWKGNVQMRPCAMGHSWKKELYAETRLLHPMKRVGERGTNSFERISWDQAIEEIAQKLTQDFFKYGGESLVTSTGGGGNPHFSSPCRFTQALGSPNIFEPGCAQCFLPRMATFSLMYGGSKSGTTSMADSKYGGCSSLYFPEDNPIQTLVMWGTCTSYHAPSGSGRAIAELRAREQGLNMVVVDPRFTPDAAMADVWLPIRPGTDVALMMTWIRYIIENKLYDEDFCKRWTNLPYLIDTDTKKMLRAYEVGLGEADAEDAEKTFVVWDQKTNSAKALPWPYDEALDPAFFGTYEIDGVEYPTAFTLLQERVDEWTLEKGCEVCCLEKDQVEKAIRIYAENAPSGLVLGVATDMSPQSAQGTEGACILEFLLGNVEKPGALLQRFPDPPNKVDLGTMNTLVTGDMLEKRLGYREHKGLGIWSHAHIPTVFKAITTGEPYQPRNWMERSGNKHAMIGNAGQLSEIIDKMEMICHLYMYPTAFTIEAADYVLPTQEWLESYFTIAHANKIIIRQPVVHLYETVNEGVIWSEIAHRCAELGNPFAQKAFDKEYLATLGTDLVYWRGQQEMMDFHMGSLPMSWDELAEMGTYEWISKEDYLTYYTYKTIDPKTGKEKGWNTPSKKVEPYSEGTLMLGRERRGQILRHAAGRRRLRSFDLLSGARGDEPHRYGISHHADPGTHSALPSRHVAQHSVSARAVSGAAGQHPSRDRREVRRGGRAVGVGGKPSRQGAREGACDGGHRKRRRAHGTLLESRVPGHRHAEQGLD